MTNGSRQMIARANNVAFLLIEFIIPIYQHKNTRSYLCKILYLFGYQAVEAEVPLRRIDRDGHASVYEPDPGRIIDAPKP